MSNGQYETYPKHIGGGKHKLSNSYRVEGKQAAISAQQDLKKHNAKKNGNKPAYPIDIEVKNIDSDSLARQVIKEWSEELGYGLTKRERFAMAAMQGLLSNSGGPVQANSRSGTGYCNCDAEGVAKWAVENADALLKELEEQTND